MKKIFLLFALCLPLCATAQNTWEEPEATEESEKANPDQKYLAGAVPLVDGHVVFRTSITAEGKSAKQLYDIALDYMTKMAKEKNQNEQSRIVIADSAKHIVAGSYNEWLVFKSSALVLDRTRFIYNLIVNCFDGRADINLTRISYLYEEERDPQRYAAEEWITDESGLNKKKTKLARISGKFRKKTIDRKDYLFGKFAKLMK